jgi:hypothetical protein
LSYDDCIPKPEWYPVKFSMNSPYSDKNGARILVSFAMIEYHDSYAVDTDQIELNKSPNEPGGLVKFYSDQTQG